MARLRSPVSRSEANTASSTPSSRPANRLSSRRIRSAAFSPSTSWISPEHAMAPELTIALNGRLSGAQPDRIERIAARLDADHGLDPFGADRFERQRKHEGLRDRLDRERHGGVADFVDVAIHGCERDPEMARVGLLQFRDVIGNRAATLVCERRMRLREKLQKRVGSFDLATQRFWRNVHAASFREGQAIVRGSACKDRAEMSPSQRFTVPPKAMIVSIIPKPAQRSPAK